MLCHIMPVFLSSFSLSYLLYIYTKLDPAIPLRNTSPTQIQWCFYGGLWWLQIALLSSWCSPYLRVVWQNMPMTSLILLITWEGCDLKNNLINGTSPDWDFDKIYWTWTMHCDVCINYIICGYFFQISNSSNVICCWMISLCYIRYVTLLLKINLASVCITYWVIQVFCVCTQPMRDSVTL